MRQIIGRHGPGRGLALRGFRSNGRAAIAAGVLVGCLGVSPAFPQSFVETYATLRACQSAGRLTDTECKNAFANAQAELDEATPRFPARSECESAFHHCMIAGFGGSGKNPSVMFEPSMRAIELHLRSSSDRTVLPLIEGSAPGLVFAPRTINRLDTGVSATRHAQVQAQWQAMPRAAAPDPSAVPAGDIVQPPVSSKPAEQVPADPAATVKRQQQLKSLPYVP